MKISYAQGVDLFLIFDRTTFQAINMRRQNAGLLRGSGLTTRIPYELATISMGGKSVSLVGQPVVLIDKISPVSPKLPSPDKNKNESKTVTPPLPDASPKKADDSIGPEIVPTPPRKKKPRRKKTKKENAGENVVPPIEKK